MKAKNLIKFLIFTLIVLISLTCSFTPISIGEKPVASEESITATFQMIKTSASTITIQWDAPDGENPGSYKLYYREYQGNIWKEVADIDGSSALEFIVDYSSLGTTVKDIVFGVSAVYTDEESLIHSSLDSTAIPSTGWYIHWN